MKAINIQKYGDPNEVMTISEIDKPQVKENCVLVKIRATTINDYDWSLVRGKPRVYRLIFGFKKPKNPIPGMEFSGIIESVGSKVEKWKVGDSVYADTSDFGFGSFAEYMSIHENALTLKPDYISFEEAAALPHASGLAYQGLVEKGKIKSGEKILINGGGGGVGTLALQIAKMYNSEVTGVDSGDKLIEMKKMGYDKLIDYKKENFNKNKIKYDLILDCRSTRAGYKYFRSLSANGRYITIGGQPDKLISILFWGKLLGLFTKKKVQILALKTNKNLASITEIFKENQINPIIDGPYKLEETPRLVAYFGAAKHCGKIVITM